MIEQILQADRLLQVDQVEPARQLYQRVVELDPGNAIATVGLAQCALASGDDRGAYELASRALQLDPENDMARRMEARLAEILATRGEEVQRPVTAATPGSRAMRPMVTEAAPSDPEDKTGRGQGAPDVGKVVASGGVAEESTAPTPPTGAAVTASQASRPSATTPAPVPAARRSLLDRLMGR